MESIIKARFCIVKLHINSVNESLKQLFNGILILGGGSLLAYSLTVRDVNVYIQVLGLLLLMIGAHRASKHWAKHKDDHLDEK